MRHFNTSGPCDPKLHYTVMRENLLEQGRIKARNGRYFTIFAPRQSGKTTFFQLLLAQLKQEGGLTPIWMTFENLKTATREEFYSDLALQLGEELEQYQVDAPRVLTSQSDVENFFRNLHGKIKPIVLFIDEFEGIPANVLAELMHTFRKIYHRKEHFALHSVALVGVSTVAELVVSSASPFNVVDELELPYFTFDEVRELLGQHVAESGQAFDAQAVKAIYDNTRGQPGLVCGVCAHLVETIAPDGARPITLPDVYATLKYFLTSKFDKNLINIVQKAREKKAFMLKVLFKDEPIPFSVHDPDMAWLFANGVIQKNARDEVEIAVPLYGKVLITAFRPLINGESEHYVSAHDSVRQYVTADGLNLRAMLDKYREYVRRRGFRAFDTKHLKEGAWHYSLDGFLNFFIRILEGDTFVEVPTGRGRTDIFILYRRQRYVIETKIFLSDDYFQKGKRQLADYLDSERLSEGYYVVFSKKHREDEPLYFEEEINGKRIYTYIICTNFERATEA